MNLILMLTALSLIVFYVIMCYMSHIKKKSYWKGYNECDTNISNRLMDTATWFSAGNSGDYKIRNVLYLYGLRQNKNKHVSSDNFRNAILNMDHNKSITDLNEDEIKSLLL